MDVNLEINWKGKYKDIRDYIKGSAVCNKSKGLGDTPVKRECCQQIDN